MQIHSHPATSKGPAGTFWRFRSSLRSRWILCPRRLLGQGAADLGGGQAEALRVPQAAEHLPSLPSGVDDALLPLLLTLSDVMGCDWQRYSARS